MLRNRRLHDNMDAFMFDVQSNFTPKFFTMCVKRTEREKKNAL